MAVLQKYLPRNAPDALAMVFTIVMVPVAYLHGVFNIAPIVFRREEDLTSYYISVGFMTFLLANTVFNYWLLLTVDTSCSRVVLPVVAPSGWSHCPYCQHNAPPRSHHCPICRLCILRRDHHCYFAGKCVGYYNHRYFISFLVYVTVAAVYGVVLSFWAVSILVGGFTWTVIPSLVFPVLAWVLQMMPVSPFIMVETSIAMFASLGAGGLLLLQLYQAHRGETYWEFQRGVKFYNRGFVRNMTEIMGKNWWICWLSPFIPSPRVGDGSQYQPRDRGAPSHPTQNSWPQAAQRKDIKGL